MWVRGTWLLTSVVVIINVYPMTVQKQTGAVESSSQNQKSAARPRSVSVDDFFKMTIRALNADTLKAIIKGSLARSNGKSYYDTYCKPEVTVDLKRLLALEIDHQKAPGLNALQYCIVVGCKQDPWLACQCVKLLLRTRVALETVTADGSTILHLAVATGSIEMVALVLELGVIDGLVAIDAVDNQGGTALHRVCLLKIDSKEPIYHVIRAVDSFNIMRWLVALGARIDIRDKFSRTPLMLACGMGRLRMVRYLLAEKIDANAVDYKGRTALHYAFGCDKSLTPNGEHITESKKNAENMIRKTIVEELFAHGALLFTGMKDELKTIANNRGYEALYDAVSSCDACGF